MTLNEAVLLTLLERAGQSAAQVLDCVDLDDNWDSRGAAEDVVEQIAKALTLVRDAIAEQGRDVEKFAKEQGQG